MNLLSAIFQTPQVLPIPMSWNTMRVTFFCQFFQRIKVFWTLQRFFSFFITLNSLWALRLCVLVSPCAYSTTRHSLSTLILLNHGKTLNVMTVELGQVTATPNISSRRRTMLGFWWKKTNLKRKAKIWPWKEITSCWVVILILEGGSTQLSVSCNNDFTSYNSEYNYICNTRMNSDYFPDTVEILGMCTHKLQPLIHLPIFSNV